MNLKPNRLLSKGEAVHTELGNMCTKWDTIPLGKGMNFSIHFNIDEYQFGVR